MVLGNNNPNLSTVSLARSCKWVWSFSLFLGGLWCLRVGDIMSLFVCLVLFRARRRRRRHVRPSPHGIAIAKKRKINTHVANPQQKDNTINTIQAFISCRSQSNIPECGSKGICTYLVPAQARSNPKVIFFLSLSILSWHQQELHLI
jgi:hypothetical protein